MTFLWVLFHTFVIFYDLLYNSLLVTFLQHTLLWLICDILWYSIILYDVFDSTIKPTWAKNKVYGAMAPFLLPNHLPLEPLLRPNRSSLDLPYNLNHTSVMFRDTIQATISCLQTHARLARRRPVLTPDLLTAFNTSVKFVHPARLRRRHVPHTHTRRQELHLHFDLHIC